MEESRKQYCPNCDYPVYVIEGQIVADKHPVKSCPNCLIELFILNDNVVTIKEMEQQ